MQKDQVNDFQLARKKLKVVEICRDSIIFVHRQKGNRFLCEKHLILDHVASQASSTLVSESCRKTDLNQPQLKTNFNTALLTLITRKGKTLNNKMIADHPQQI